METAMPNESRASVDSTSSHESHGEYNRIHLESSFRDKIIAQFEDDSTDSLPLPVTVAEDSLSSSPSTAPASKSTPQAVLPPLSTSPPQKHKAAPSRLSQVVQSSDIPTPKASQVGDPFDKGKSPETPTASNAELTLTPTPTNSKGNLSKVVTAEDSEGKSPKEGRPGTMRRLTSRIKKTISSKG